MDSDSRSPTRNRTAPGTAIIGHRGAAGSAPENTLASLREAARRGARQVEFDVRLTADGVAVLLHDADLDRTTDGTGPLAIRALDEVAALDAGGWFGPTYEGEVLPTLAEALALVGCLELAAVIELKTDAAGALDTVRATIAEVRQQLAGMDTPLMISSSCVEAVGEIRRVAPEIPRALVVSDPTEERFEAARDLGCHSVHVDARVLTPERIGRALHHVGSVAAYTVNDRSRAEELAALGVDAVFTDHPERLPPEWLARAGFTDPPSSRRNHPPAA